jgi:hypothetical protein
VAGFGKRGSLKESAMAWMEEMNTAGFPSGFQSVFS